MCTIRPFAAIRYDESGSADLSTRLAPPYDVLDQSDKQRLLARDERNFVKVDLPHVPPKAAGPPASYEQAAQQVSDWLADGTLTHDRRPALYVYHQSFTQAGTEYTRKMFFASLKIEAFGTGSVFPHEQTFGGPKEDRLALTKATRANMSPVFGLFEDAQNAVAQRLERAIGPTPLLYGELDQTRNMLWAMDDEQVIDEVTAMMAPKAMYIADGHHRYGTAMLYRDWLSEREALPADHPARYVLCVFCAMEDPGLLILPTHRLLPGLHVASGVLRRDERLEVAHLTVEQADDAPAALAKFGPQAVALFSAAEDRYLMVKPREASILDPLEPEHSEAWRRLGLAFLHAYLLERVVAPELAEGGPPQVRYVKAAGQAVDEARSTSGSVFLMQPSTMEELRAVCKAGDLMPQKSTFFYPKLASGLVIHSLAE